MSNILPQNLKKLSFLDYFVKKELILKFQHMKPGIRRKKLIKDQTKPR